MARTKGNGAMGPWAYLGARTRLVAMVLAGTVAWIVVGLTISWMYAPVAGWDLSALVFIVWVWIVVTPMSSAATKSHALRENPGRAISDVLVLAAAVASLVAVGIVLIRAGSSHDEVEKGLLAGLGVGSIALSWAAVHTLFMLRYALLYYSGSDGGIAFNQQLAPRYLDFGYLSFTLGMTFQVSDTNITSPVIRATVLRHALLSYLFGAVVLASSINLVVNLGAG